MREKDEEIETIERERERERERASKGKGDRMMGKRDSEEGVGGGGRGEEKEVRENCERVRKRQTVSERKIEIWWIHAYLSRGGGLLKKQTKRYPISTGMEVHMNCVYDLISISYF